MSWIDIERIWCGGQLRKQIDSSPVEKYARRGVRVYDARLCKVVDNDHPVIFQSSANELGFRALVLIYKFK